MHSVAPARRRPISLLALSLVLSVIPLVAASPVQAAEPGDLVINEVMQNPAAVNDDAGEWFEVFNPTDTDVDIEGWIISDNGIDSHTIANGAPLIVPAGGYLVLGNNGDAASNGGVEVDYVYGSSFFLANADDELALSEPGDPDPIVIDLIEWDGGAEWPDPNGASMSFRPGADDNNVGANWCESTTAFGVGDLGTPGAENNCDEPPPPDPDPAPELVINEVMQNPAAVNDDAGEWFEVFNPTDTDVDIEGWTVTDAGTDSHTIANGAPLLVPAGGFVVLGNNSETTTNGGVEVDYVYSGIALANGDDELILANPEGAESDRIEWDGGPDWPDPNGATMGFDPGDDDNNVGANWCEAITPFGDGDLGTPGAANDDCEDPPPTPTDPVTISEIQGAGHISPYNNVEVTTTGIVTAIQFTGFYAQDPVGDGDPATSEGLFVFMGNGFGANPTVAIGDDLELTDTVTEFIPGGAGTGNLSITQMSFPVITVLSSGNDLPEPSIIGKSGRIPPAVDVTSEDELPVNLQEVAGEFDPDNDGIDFYESLEGMRVTVEEPQVVGATRTFGTFSTEMFTVTNNGKLVKPRDAMTKRGGIELQPDPNNQGDQNPERVQIQFDSSIGNPGTAYPGEAPSFAVGARLKDITGVVGYDFGNFEVLATEPVTGRESKLRPEESRLRSGRHWLTVASYNVLNLSPGPEDDEQRAKLADQIVDALNSPDVIALQEVQDNSGEVDDGTVAADQTLQALADAIAAAGGPEYAFIDNPPVDNAEGGVPGGNIRNAFLYRADRVDLVDTFKLSPTVLSLVGADPDAFAATRSPLLGVFSFNGEEFNVLNNHFPSRSGSTPIFGGPQPFVQFGEEERAAAAAAINTFVDWLLEGDDDSNVMVVGDFNTFQWTDDLSEILPGAGKDRVLTNLIGAKLMKDDRDDVYSYIFEGNSQVLDHFFVTDGLKKVASFDIVHANVDFPIVPGVTTASDHEPLLAQFRVKQPREPRHFDLQILHASDLEGGVNALDRAPNFAAIVDKLEDNRRVDASVTLSAGDNYIPGPFFSAAGDASFGPVFNDVYNTFYGLGGAQQYAGLAAGGGRVDISIMNVIGFDASAVGNHEFDLGSDAFEQIIEENFGNTADLSDDAWVGAQFPYLSSNLDFSGDADLGDLFTSALRPNTAFETGPFESATGQSNRPKLAPATFIDVGGGEKIGVVGATTPLLQTISSPSGTTVIGPTSDDMPALAAVIQPQVDALEAAGIDKIVLVSHLQQITLEEELVTLLDGVDVVIAGGSDTLLANPDDALRDGDVAERPYPIITEDVDGDPAVIVSTDGEYSYVGQLVVRFDRDGDLIGRRGNQPLDGLDDLDLRTNGPVKTEAEDVSGLWGNGDPFATGTKGELVSRLVDAAREVVIAKDSNVVGETSVFLEGRREKVRTEETNLGNLTAEANLAIGRSHDATTAVSIKNGGGIRAEIGEIGDGGALLPPQPNPLSGKELGQVSQLDIENSLRFNNALSLVTVTAAELVALVEHSVAATAPGSTPGQFPQIAGMRFSFDPDSPSGSRVESLAIVDDAGVVLDVVVSGGDLQGDANRTIRVVTLSFLVDGGDGYPFPDNGTRVDLASVLTEPGLVEFAAPGTEQDALAEYFANNHAIGAGVPFDEAETPPANDTRIQNLNERSDTVLS